MPKYLNLNPEEKILKIVYQHPIVIRWKLLISLIVIASPFFFLALLLRLDRIGWVFFTVILVIGLYYGFRTVFIWRANRFYITTEKIIDVDQKGFFDKTVSQCALEKIIDISFNYKGVTQNLMNFGNISILIGQGSTKIFLKNIPHPQKVQRILSASIDEVKQKLNHTPARQT